MFYVVQQKANPTWTNDKHPNSASSRNKHFGYYLTVAVNWRLCEKPKIFKIKKSNSDETTSCMASYSSSLEVILASGLATPNIYLLPTSRAEYPWTCSDGTRLRTHWPLANSG